GLADEHVARAAIQARTAAVGARALADVLGQFLAHRRGLGFAVAALEVGDDALELVPALAAAAAVGEVGEADRLALAAVQDRVPDVLLQFLPGRVHAEGVVPRQR